MAAARPHRIAEQRQVLVSLVLPEPSNRFAPRVKVLWGCRDLQDRLPMRGLSPADERHCCGDPDTPVFVPYQLPQVLPPGLTFLVEPVESADRLVSKLGVLLLDCPEKELAV